MATPNNVAPKLRRRARVPDSFAVLVVAEMIGVKAGLGWYLQWAQGWAAYSNMYAALIVMSLLCSGAITLLFRTRDRLLVWQKGVVKW
jgi:NitT/TauT family transport system permease protein